MDMVSAFGMNVGWTYCKLSCFGFLEWLLLSNIEFDYEVSRKSGEEVRYAH
jgi:hypothetical protein